MVKAFYKCGVLLDVCDVFNEKSEEIEAQKKYAKWKATYIHNCLKNGETPIPGPVHDGEEDDPTAPHDSGASSGNYVEFTANQPTPAAEIPQPIATREPEAPPTQLNSSQPATSSGFQPTPKMTSQAQKYCKYANSELDLKNYDSAVDYLTKALSLITKGTE